MSAAALPSGSSSAGGPPRRAWAGAALPGLGHLLQGDLQTGLPLLLYTGVLGLSAALAAPRLRRLLLPTAREGGFALHPWVALAAWIAAALALWALAIRRARRAPGARPRADGRWTQARIVWRQFARHHMGVVGLHCVLLLALVTCLAPFLAVNDPDAIDAGPLLEPPGRAFPFGTDGFGRDLLARVLYGARVSLSIGFLAVGISATFGALWGAVSGYFGGRVDTVMMWLVDFLLSLPRLVLVLTLVGLYRPRGVQGLYLIVLILGFTGWMGVSRIVRGMVLSLKEQEFVQAARALGQRNRFIIARHLLPNALAPVIVYATLGIGHTILTEATLSFLGLGVPPPISTWGSIVNDGREYLRSAWWIATLPGFLIVFAVMSFNLLGDGLRDALDPKLRHR